MVFEIGPLIIVLGPKYTFAHISSNFEAAFLLHETMDIIGF